jgi:hypothetical protein
MPGEMKSVGPEPVPAEYGKIFKISLDMEYHSFKIVLDE